MAQRGSRTVAAIAVVVALIVVGRATFGVSASWAPPPPNHVFVPAHEAPLRVFTAVNNRQRGHTYTFFLGNHLRWGTGERDSEGSGSDRTTEDKGKALQVRAALR